MKNFLAIVSTVLLSLSASAGVGSWQLMNEQHYSAADNEAFMVLQSQFPEHFGDLDGTAVTTASLDLFNFQFVGPTQCQPNDPRLNAQTVSKSVCFNTGMCEGMSTVLVPVDPCL